MGEFQLVTSNMVRLLNLMRVYQFREELIRGLRIQIKEKKKKIEEIQNQLNEAKEVLQQSLDTLQQVEKDRDNSENTSQNETQNRALKELITGLSHILQNNK